MSETIALQVNSELRTLEVDADTPLLWVLRETLALTGTKFGCGIAQCGACTVHVNGAAVRSCVTPVSAAVGKSITTIEGVNSEAAQGVAKRAADAIQNSWVALDVPQCGYCQSGQVMSAVALLAANTSPSDGDIDAAMQGNICRCGAYPRIRAAIHRASAQLRLARSET